MSLKKIVDKMTISCVSSCKRTRTCDVLRYFYTVVYYKEYTFTHKHRELKYVFKKDRCVYTLIFTRYQFL